MAGQLGLRAALAATTDSSNREIPTRIADRILESAPPGSTVAVLGLAYKPHSHVTEESQGLAIAQHLSRNGLRVVAFDPLSAEMSLAGIRRDILVLDSVEECLSQAETVVITTPDPMFDSLRPEDFKNPWATVRVFDLWRRLASVLHGQPHINYTGIGLSTDDERNSANLKELWWGETGDAAEAVSE